MRGVNAADGRRLSGRAHLRQSIRDVLTTPIGSRVMRPDYGSRLFQLVDRPANRGLAGDLVAAAAEALDRWEPRFRLLSASVDVPSPGHVRMDLDGIYVPDGTPLRVAGVEA
ncbi:MAG: hypothetical protein F4X56_00725 [Gammaproteobacteria bacterium]|nr:hypothetical protein [Gammaproteobacteria bacterium]